MPTWPLTLPQTPLQDGYSETLEKNVIVTSMDQGPAKTRKRFTAGVKKYQVSFLMSSSQLSTFETFYEDTINFGATTFTFPDPRSGSNADFRIDMSQNAPTIQPLSGGQYNVSFAMEKLP